MIAPHQTILFQGDSITDAGRVRDCAIPNGMIGLAGGYAGQIAASLLSARPNDGLTFVNRGISGNRVTDLLTRWQADAVHVKPDLVSILIGVNDTWHKFTQDTGTSLCVYEKTYRLLLEFTLERLPAVRFVLCEPFALVVGQVQPEWCDELKERSKIVRSLARDFNAVFVPFQELFDQLLTEAPAAYWLPDGVHPSPGAHARMAAFWLKQVNGSE